MAWLNTTTDASAAIAASSNGSYVELDIRSIIWSRILCVEDGDIFIRTDDICIGGSA